VIDKELSQQIYREFMNGRVINELVYQKDGSMQPDARYEELFNNYDSDYRELYENIGYELILKDGFAFSRSLDEDDSYSDVAMKIQSLLMIIARGIQELGYDFELLTTHDAGVSDHLLEQVETGEKRDILLACGLKKSLIDEVKNVLETRNIAYRNAKGKLVLTAAGQGFFDEVFGDV
jgi:hypothetical protein